MGNPVRCSHIPAYGTSVDIFLCIRAACDSTFSRFYKVVEEIN